MWICITKNQFTPSVHSSNTVNFKVPSQDWPHQFLTMQTPKTFNLISMKLYQHAKNKLIPLVNSISSPESRLAISTCWKWDCFINLLGRNSSFRNPGIWLADWILAYISGIRFLGYRICAGTQQIKIFNTE